MIEPRNPGLSIDVDANIGALSLRVVLPPHDGTTVIVGPNGAGKSTLLRCLLGAVRMRRGEIKLGDVTLFSDRDRVNAPIEDRRLGYLPQKYGLFPHMSVSDNVAFGMRKVATSSDRASRKADKAARAARVRQLLEDLGVLHLADRKTSKLSGGESQRVALARALAIGPRALLLDEPMAALDAGARRKVRRFLSSRLRAIGIPTVVVSHDVADLEALGGRVAVLEGGTITQVGTLADLRAEPGSKFVEEFVCGVAETHQPLAEIASWDT